MPTLSAAPAVLMLLLGAAAALPAQQPSPRSDDSARVVVIQEKSPAAASVLEFFAPGVGYAYAGSWTRGILPTAVRLAGFALWLDSDLFTPAVDPPCEAQCTAGVAMMMGGMGWAVFDAGQTAKRTNARRRADRVRVMLLPPRGDAPLIVRVAVGR